MFGGRHNSLMGIMSGALGLKKMFNDDSERRSRNFGVERKRSRNFDDDQRKKSTEQDSQKGDSRLSIEVPSPRVSPNVLVQEGFRLPTYSCWLPDICTVQVKLNS